MTTMNDERAAIEAAYAGVAEGGWDSVKDMGIKMFKAGAAWQRAQGAVPDGFMPIPTAEQLAEALDNVRSFHDMSAELIAPELLTNLRAALAASTGQEVES